jgi:hypothetical protein
MRCSIILLLLCHAWMTLGLPLHLTRHPPSSILSNASFSSIFAHSKIEALKRQLGLVLNVGQLAWHGHHRSPAIEQSSATHPTPLPTTQLMHLNTADDNSSFPRSPFAVLQRYSQSAKVTVLNVAATKSSAPTSRSNRPYGTFLPESTPTPVSGASIVPFRRSNLTATLVRKVSRMDIVALCHQFTPEIIGLGIFLLVPAAVLIVEGMDMLYAWWTPERFPERGRDRVRLTGPERQLRAFAAWNREKMVAEHSRRWRHRRSR